MAEKMLRITQVRSLIGRVEGQRATVRSLGLKRIRHTVVQPDRPEIRGMLNKVPHLVEWVEEAAEPNSQERVEEAAEPNSQERVEEAAEPNSQKGDSE